jgi:hypothetical protein
MHVKRSNWLDGNLPTKQNNKIVLVIVRFYKDGRFGPKYFDRHEG